MSRIDIVNGPGKFALFISLAEGSINDRRKVTFETNDARFPKVEVVVNELTRAGAFGEKWLFGGRGDSDGLRFKVRGEYHVELHLGWLTLEQR